MPKDTAVGVTNNPAGSQVLVREVVIDQGGVPTLAEMQIVQLADPNGVALALATRTEQEVRSIETLDLRRATFGRGRIETTDRRGSVGYRGSNR